jgi:nitrogen fixation protein
VKPSEELRALIDAIRQQAARREAGCALYVPGIDLDAALLLVDAIDLEDGAVA